MEAQLVWACNLPASRTTSDGVTEQFDLRVNARLDDDGEIRYDLISLAFEPDLKGKALNVTGKDILGVLELYRVPNPQFNASQVQFCAEDALTNTPTLKFGLFV